MRKAQLHHGIQQEKAQLLQIIGETEMESHLQIIGEMEMESHLHNILDNNSPIQQELTTD